MDIIVKDISEKKKFKKDGHLFIDIRQARSGEGMDGLLKTEKERHLKHSLKSCLPSMLKTSPRYAHFFV